MNAVNIVNAVNLILINGEVLKELFMNIQGQDCLTNVGSYMAVKLVILWSHKATNYLLIMCLIPLDQETKMTLR